MAIEVWFVFAFLCLMAGLSPGLAVFLSISNVISYGRGPTLVSALGNSLGLLVLGLSVGLGLGALMEASALVFTGVKVVGGIYLLWLGIKAWRANSTFTEGAEKLKLPSNRELFGSAFILCITNVKAVVIMGALFPAFMNADKSVFFQSLIMSLTYSTMCLIVHFSIAYFGAYLRPFFKSSQRIKYLRRTIGGLFVGAGVALVASR